MRSVHGLCNLHRADDWHESAKSRFLVGNHALARQIAVGTSHALTMLEAEVGPENVDVP